jgi:hypothetical protein
MGNIGSHANITSGRQRYQAKNEGAANMHSFQRAQARPIMSAGAALPVDDEVAVDSRCF